jgi:hypothetical protein
MKEHFSSGKSGTQISQITTEIRGTGHRLQDSQDSPLLPSALSAVQKFWIQIPKKCCRSSFFSFSLLLFALLCGLCG